MGLDKRLAHDLHENQTDAQRFIVPISPPFGEIKTGLSLRGNVSFRVIRDGSWATPIALVRFGH
jgi:hypothetical protein